MSARRWWYAFTPAGSLILSTGAATREACIRKLLREGAHMPYGTWENFEKRGYELSQLPIEPTDRRGTLRHGCCVVCGVPWPCEYAGKPPAPAAKVADALAELVAFCEQGKDCEPESPWEEGYMAAMRVAAQEIRDHLAAHRKGSA